MSNQSTAPCTDERGFGLIEVLVSLIVLSTALIGLAGAAGLASQRATRSRYDLEVWAALQSKVDSLMAIGAANVSDGSASVKGQEISWTVSGTTPKRVDLVMSRSSQTRDRHVADSLVVYLVR